VFSHDDSPSPLYSIFDQREVWFFLSFLQGTTKEVNSSCDAWVLGNCSYLLVVCSNVFYFLPSISLPAFHVPLQLHLVVLGPPNRYGAA
jgi:hypothetical protein